MKCEHNKAHNKLSFATLKHLAGVLDAQLQQQGVKSQSKRELICGRFLFQAAYFLDNQWVEFDGKRYRVGLCFQEFAKDAFAPTKALVTDYADGEILHEAALGRGALHEGGHCSEFPTGRRGLRERVSMTLLLNNSTPVNALMPSWFHAGRAWRRVNEQQRSAKPRS